MLSFFDSAELIASADVQDARYLLSPCQIFQDPKYFNLAE